MALSDIMARVQQAEAAAGRALGSTQVIAISKRQPEARIRAALRQGHRLFGENQVQEAASKWPALRAQYAGVALHLVGPLQTNKARQAMQMFDAIHTLDRPRLAQTLARLAQELGHCPALFIQVNTGKEPQKAGVAPEEADGFIAFCRGLALPVVGLMCLPPMHETPDQHFACLRDLAQRHGIDGLSMGMSGDFEGAIALGATHVRLGTAIFGLRDSA
ncbi:MAG: YggS family pyridoxal phosphate-dependent enzyme [Rhodobacteraceae bacterium]|nr:YggS family pyridoxal phosphate-dependent enzyme [Paracoccaceae bacterium]